MTVTLLAGAAGALLATGTVLALPRAAELPFPMRGLVARLVEELRRSMDTLRELGSVGAPLARPRARRLRLASAAAGGMAGGMLLGMRGALLCGVAAAWLAPRMVAARRR